MSWDGDYLALHTRLRHERRRRRITQADAASLISVCERTFRDFESGRSDLPAAKVFCLAAALGIHLKMQRSI